MIELGFNQVKPKRTGAAEMINLTQACWLLKVPFFDKSFDPSTITLNWQLPSTIDHCTWLTPTSHHTRTWTTHLIQHIHNGFFCSYPWIRQICKVIVGIGRHWLDFVGIHSKEAIELSNGCDSQGLAWLPTWMSL